MSAAEKIALGDHDEELNAIINAVTERKRHLAPWEALDDLCSLHRRIQEEAEHSTESKSMFAVTAYKEVQKNYLTHPSEIVVAAAKLIRRDLLVNLLGITPDRVDEWEQNKAVPSE